jgi:hypothetical protein
MPPPTNPSPQEPAHGPHDQPVRLDTKPCENRTMAQRVLVHISRSEQRVIDPDGVYCLVATGGDPKSACADERRSSTCDPWENCSPPSNPSASSGFTTSTPSTRPTFASSASRPTAGIGRSRWNRR